MCGLAGIFRPGGVLSHDAETVSSMMTRLVNRGPDGIGMVSVDEVTLGHRRLKILDLSDGAKQPMTSRCGRFIMVYNGECYNFQDLRAELGLSQSDLRSTSDTEILLEAWSLLGPSCLQRVVGQFAMAVYDKAKRELYLVRDRFGEKPLFYHQSPQGTVSFASSLGAMLAANGVPKQFDPESVEELLTLRYVIAPKTVIKQVFKVKPGCMLIVNQDGLQKKRWFEVDYKNSGEDQPKIRQEDVVEEFDRLLRQATLRCLVSDVPTGLLLSDGIDSQSINTILAQEQASIPTFTYGYFTQDGQLSPLGQVGDASKQNNHNFSFSAEERVEAMVPAFSSLNEPVGDGASLATWLLLKKASRHATVFLCGHGADETLGGYRLSQEQLRLRVLKKLSYLPPSLSTKLFTRFMNGAESINERASALRLAPKNLVPATARYLIHRPLPIRDLEVLFQRSREESSPPYLDVISALYRDCRADASGIDRIQKVMLRTFLSENILTYADSSAMDQSTELRMPFLDRDLFDFVMKLPSEYRVGAYPGSRHTKVILRKWGERHLGVNAAYAKKRSFDFGSLRSLLDSHGPTLRSYVLDSTVVRDAVPGAEQWLSQPSLYFRGCWQGTLWALLALGIWAEANGVRA